MAEVNRFYFTRLVHLLLEDGVSAPRWTPNCFGY